MAAMIDAMWRIAWLQGGSEGPAPEPLRRPGQPQPNDDVTTDEDKDLAPVSPEDFDEWYRAQFRSVDKE